MHRTVDTCKNGIRAVESDMVRVVGVPGTSIAVVVECSPVVGASEAAHDLGYLPVRRGEIEAFAIEEIVGRL